MRLKAHVIRDRSSLRHRAVCGLSARYRWCLTGTPIHNKVDDYGALISFLRVLLFSDQQYFSQHISHPIKSKNKLGFERLEKLVRATSLRRTKITELIGLDLPPRESKKRENFTIFLNQGFQNNTRRFLRGKVQWAYK